MVQLSPWEGRELEQESRKNGQHNIPEEHSDVLGGAAQRDNTSHARRTKETEAFAKQTIDWYEKECQRIWKESEKWRKEEP